MNEATTTLTRAGLQCGREFDQRDRRFEITQTVFARTLKSSVRFPAALPAAANVVFLASQLFDSWGTSVAVRWHLRDSKFRPQIPKR